VRIVPTENAASVTANAGRAPDGAPPADGRNALRLWEAADALEGLFVTQLVKASQMAAGSAFGSVPGGSVLQGLAEEALGTALAESADFGVASGLFRDLGGGEPPIEAMRARALAPHAAIAAERRLSKAPNVLPSPLASTASPVAPASPDALPVAPPAGEEAAANRRTSVEAPSWLAARLAPFEDAIREAAARFGIDSDLIRAVISRESGGDPSARSPKGARGLMQIVPATGRALGLSHPFDPRENILAGTRYLAEMLDRHAGDLPLALASYNAGPGAVARHGGIPPFRETLRYVSDVMSLFDSLRGTRATEAIR